MSPVSGPSSIEMDDEDCSFLLRELELFAFSAVVSAMRAQGAFNKYKEVVLENVKKVFFISDEIFKSEVRRAANDEHLTRIASALNPSYDSYVEWGVLSLDTDEDVIEVPQPKLFDGGVSHSEADELLRMASQHNDRLADQDLSMCNLLQAPTKPYVPERLRVLLRDSENLHTQRITPPPVLSPPLPGPLKLEIEAVTSNLGRKIPVCTPRGSRRRKTRAEKQKEIEETVHAVAVASSPVPGQPMEEGHRLSDASDPIPTESTETLNSCPQPKPSPVVKYESEPGPSVSQAPSVSSCKDHDPGVKEILNIIQRQMQEEQRLGIPDQPARRKRKSKASPSDPSSECARTRPFVFPPYNKDGTKPPRGNPERLDRTQRPSNGSTNLPPFSPNHAQLNLLSTENIAVNTPVSTVSTVVTGSQGTSSAHQHIPASPSSLSTNSIQSVMMVDSGSVSKDRDLSCSSGGTVYNVIRRPNTTTASVLTVTQKAVSASITTPTIPNVLKRSRLSSSNEEIPVSAQGGIRTMTAPATIRRQILQTTTLPVSSKKIPDQVTSQLQNSPTMPNQSRSFVSGSSSSMAVNAAQRSATQSPISRPATSGTGPVLTSYVSSFSSATANDSSNGCESVLPRPILKRNIYKASATGGVTTASGIRLTNGMTSQNNRVVTVHKAASPSRQTACSPSTSTIVGGSSPSPSPSSSQSGSLNIVRKFLPVGSTSVISQNQLHHPIGQFILRKSGASVPAPDPPLPDYDVVAPAPKRLIYCEPASSLNSHGHVQGDSYSVAEASTVSREVISSTSEISTTETVKESLVRPVYLRASSNADGSFSVRDPSPGCSRPFGESPSAGYPSHNYEIVQRVYKLQSDGAQGMEAQPFVIRAHEASPVPTTLSSTQMDTEGEDSESQPVTDILQQSMMEIT